MKALTSIRWTKPDYDWPQQAIYQRFQMAALIALLTMCAFFLLLTLKAFDDNRLTSWQWVFVDARAWWVCLLMLPALALAWFGAGLRVPRPYKVLLLFLSAFAAGMLFWNEPEVIVDTSRYFSQAKYLAVYGVAEFSQAWGQEVTAWTDLPLVPFIYGLTFTLLGESRAGIQLVTTLFFAGTVTLTYLLGRAVWDETVGFYGGALLLGMPYLLTQVPLMLADIPTMFFLTLAVYVTWQAITRGTLPLLLLAAVTITLALLAKYSTWLMLSVVPLIVLIQWQHGWRALVRRSTVITAGVLVLMGLVLAWKSGVVTEQLNLLMRYQVPGLGRWEETYASTFLFQIHPIVSIAAVCSVIIAVHQRDPRYLVIGWMLLLIVLLEIKRIRYTLITFPMLALMVAYALRYIKERRMANFLVLCTIGSAIVISFFGFSAFLKTTSAVNIQHAGVYLNTTDAETVEVIVLPQTRSSVNPAVSVPILDLFTHKKLNYAHDALFNPTPEARVIATSPVRFSWEYTSAPYYNSGATASSKIIAVIASRANQALPAVVAERIKGYRLVRAFTQNEGIFKYTTIVNIYESVSN